ncbi:hypothetical protein H5410_043180 [Solanum commersonii]|uniref:Uncharacterized protein n=1 Tax=Solanum commersonii TaxID=4109 RepID=A0A9J5XY45_SOLCO|nr:hypothetical protein H5410_043180 [Solanum commersonii]
MGTDNPLKTRRFNEVILIDIDSIEIEHSRDKNDPASSCIPVYEWWNLFGENKEVLPQQFLNQFEDSQVKEEITTLPEHIKICKYYIQKRISYIITWNFSKTKIDRIQYLCKQIQVKGWTPKQTNSKDQSHKTSSSSNTPFKAELKKKLKHALNNRDKYDEKQEMRLIEDVAATESKNEDMCNPKGLTLAYIDPNYE